MVDRIRLSVYTDRRACVNHSITQQTRGNDTRMSKKIEDELQNRFDDYVLLVQRLASREFDRIVKPYLDKNDFYLLVGNFTWTIVNPRGKGWGRSVDIDELPKKVAEALGTNVPGYSASDLGCFMNSYNPKNY